jgi:radical SAM protein with 4Fe4S-binding SPASM domain
MCNLNCYYCAADALYKKEEDPELDSHEWIAVIKRLKSIQVFDLGLSGGEIFSRDDIFDILDIAAKCKFPKITISTNGTFIDSSAAKQLKRLNLNNIAVSLDGDEGTHDRIRGAGSFAKTINGIVQLVNNGIIPLIQFTPLKSNFKSLGKLVDLLYSTGIRKLSFNALHPTGRCDKIYKNIMLDHLGHAGELRKIIDDISEKYSDFRMLNPPLLYPSYPNMLPTAKRKGKNKLKPCSAAHTSCCITSSGLVIPCSELIDFVGGSIREQDILDIWKNPATFEDVRNTSNMSTEDIPYCRDCMYNIFCNAGCRADAHSVYGDLTAPDPFCPYIEAI